jgi:DNA-binding NtrC family response regulator
VNKRISGISDQARQFLLAYPWPGNVRELEHVIERACVLCSGTTLATEHLQAEITGYRHQPGPTANEELETFALPRVPAMSPPELAPTERLLLALKKAGGNKAKAARLLGIDRTTLYRKIRELQLDISQTDF